MDDSTKSREELIAELQALRAERASARAPHDVRAFWTDPEVVRHVRAICAITGQRLYVYDLERRYLFAAHPPETGAFPMDEMVGKTPLELGLAPAQVEAAGRYFAQAIATGQPVTGEATYDTPIGRRDILITFAPLRDTTGRVVAVGSTLRDVTELHRAEEALRQSEARFRGLTEAAFEGVSIHEQGRILEVNQPFADMFGYTMDEMIGMSVHELGAPETRELVQRNIQAGVETPYEAIGLRRDGTTFPGETYSKQIPYKGRLVRVTAVRDISERKRVEAALKASEEQWRTLVTSAPNLIIESDLEGHLRFINRMPDGSAPERVQGVSFFDFIPPEDHAMVRANMAAARDTNEPRSYEVRGHDFSGRSYWFQTNVAVLRRQGQPYGYIFIATDITEVKRTYEEIAVRTAELRKAQELDRLKSNFVNAVTHELRTPLTSIKGYAEFLEDGIGGTLTEQQLGFVRHLEMGASRLERLVDDLLDFARIEAGTFQLRMADADLTAKIRDTAGSLDPQAHEARLQLKLELPEDPVMVTMDAQRIGQVLLNLLNNAIKFTPPGGTIAVRVRLERTHVRCEVADTGIGIKPDEVPKLFQRFSQLEGGLRSGTGTGLGLSISKTIVEAHQGAIGVESAPGEGSTFWFTLPAAPRVLPEELLEEGSRSR